MSDPIAVMRNRVTTEFRKVAPGSEEYLELQAQRDPNDGLPVWEETSLTNAVAQSKRMQEGNPQPADFGAEQQPVGRITGAHETFKPASSVNEPLPSEREAGVEPGPRTAMPPRDDHVEEVPQTASMESATDTDVSGTEPELPGKKRGAKKANGAKAAPAEEKASAPAAEKS